MHFLRFNTCKKKMYYDFINWYKLLMSDYFTEVNRNTFSIFFKSKVDDDKFFKYVEKNFKKWGMVDVDYDKKEKTIIGKSPALALTFWDKFPVKLNTVGLRNIIISKGDEKNSFLINVNTNEMFGNSHTIRFPTYFSKEINSKFARVISNKQTDKESENSDIKGSNNRKKISKSKKITADEKIANVKKKNPSKTTNKIKIKCAIKVRFANNSYIQYIN